MRCVSIYCGAFPALSVYFGLVYIISNMLSERGESELPANFQPTRSVQMRLPGGLGEPAGGGFPTLLHILLIPLSLVVFPG